MGLDEFYWLCRKWKALHDRITAEGRRSHVGGCGAGGRGCTSKGRPVHSIMDMRLKVSSSPEEGGWLKAGLREGSLTEEGDWLNGWLKGGLLASRNRGTCTHSVHPHVHPHVHVPLL